MRSLRQAPGFALAAILTFAIGTGATSAVFTVLHAVLLRPLPYADPERLVVLLHEGQFPVSPADYLDPDRDTRSYERVSVAQAWSATLATGGPGRTAARTAGERGSLPFSASPLRSAARSCQTRTRSAATTSWS